MLDHHFQYRLPAEWEPQSGILLTWPHIQSDWKSNLQETESVYLELARHISKHESLIIVCYDQAHKQTVQQQLQQADINLESIQFGITPSNDTWTRDYGPITILTKNGPQLLDFHFDGWGGKYSAELDNKITNILHQARLFGELPIQSIKLVLEGGSIESDGQGTLLTTQNCLFGGLRNKSFSNAQIKEQLTELFGLTRILCLQHGTIIGDDTDSHIDTLARFCDPHTIAYATCDDPQDEQYVELKAMENELKSFTMIDNQPYKLTPLPLPKPVHNSQGKRLPATYANFLITNDVVLVPEYGDIETDEVALNNLADCFPKREIVGVNCTPLIQQNGSLHCATMQLY